jgi:hypothetical protein
MNSYNKIEQKVAHIFSKFPKVKSSIKNLIKSSTIFDIKKTITIEVITQSKN